LKASLGFIHLPVP